MRKKLADESVKLVERLGLPLDNPPTALARPRSQTASRPPKPDRRRSMARPPGVAKFAIPKLDTANKMAGGRRTANQSGGCCYHVENSDKKGWLCPALFNSFRGAREYVRANPLTGGDLKTIANREPIP